jgi:hypothetical protein
MDTQRDIEEAKIEKKFGAEPDADLLVPGTENSVYGAQYYKNVWHKLLDEHFDECPTAVSARKQVKSTLCYCAQIEAANNAATAEIAAEECLRCHRLAPDCKCGPKAQLV